MLCVKKNNLEYFNKLLPIFYKEIYIYILSITQNKTLAEDALQNTLFTAYKNFSQLKNIDKFKFWIFTIARRESVAIIRKCKKEIILDNTIIEVITLQDFSPSEQHILKEELITYIKSAINQLSRKYRQVIILRYYNNLTFNEIAASLDVNSNTVRVWHMRAKSYIYDWLNTNYYK